MQAMAREQTIDVFLVDDHKCMLWGLEKLVTGEEPRMRVAGKAGNRDEALAGIRAAAPNVVVLDLDLGGSNSLEFLPELMEQSRAQVLILTGVGGGGSRWAPPASFSRTNPRTCWSAPSSACMGASSG